MYKCECVLFFCSGSHFACRLRKCVGPNGMVEIMNHIPAKGDERGSEVVGNGKSINFWVEEINGSTMVALFKIKLGYSDFFL